MFLEGKTLELMIAAVVALMVVGPKDLPILLRRFGKFMARLRGMAAEFRASFEEMARQSELDELRKEVEALRRNQLSDMAQADAAHAEMTRTVEDIHQGLADVGVQLHPPMSHQFVASPAEPAPPPEPAAAKPPRKPAARRTSAKAAMAKPTSAKPRAPKGGPAS
jgi:sec-independent protein translocase protein TatB